MPPNSKKPHTRGRWRAIALSLLVHSLIVAAAVLGWFTWKHEPPTPDTMAIEATVVDERALKGIATAPKPAPLPEPAPEPVAEPEPPPPEEQGPPTPDPEIEKRKEEERLANEKAEQEKQAQEQERLDAEKKEAERIEAEKQAAAAKLNEERVAADKKAAEKKRAEEAAAARKAAEEKARLAAQEELRRSLEAEELGNAARNSDVAASWHRSIVAKIARAWIKPPSAVAGITCTVSVAQVLGGEVTSVRVESCEPNEAALRESVEAAVYRASPLPTPPAGVPFERNLRLIFAPQ